MTTESAGTVDRQRRRILAALGGGGAGVLLGLPYPTARADTALDVEILQTASSIEVLAVAAYGAGLDALSPGGPNDAVRAFAAETMRRHGEHKKAFQAQAAALDASAKVQDAPNPKFLPVLRSADLRAPSKLVELATLLEKVAIDTYLVNLTLVQDRQAKALLAGVMAVDAQHLATLRVIGALLQAGATQLAPLPLPPAGIKSVPKAVGSVAFPDALEKVNPPELIAEPTSGAVR